MRPTMSPSEASVHLESVLESYEEGVITFDQYDRLAHPLTQELQSYPEWSKRNEEGWWYKSVINTGAWFQVL